MHAVRSVGAITAAAVSVLLLAGAAVAYAAIPNPTTGVISGCYTNSSPHILRVIDTAKTAKCPTGTTALNWNQAGPPGPTGPSGTSAETYVQDEYEFQAGQTPPAVESGTANCPSGDVATGGGYFMSGPMGIGGEATERWIPTGNNATVTAGGVPTGWEVSLDETGTAGNPQLNYILNVYAYCAAGS